MYEKHSKKLLPATHTPYTAIIRLIAALVLASFVLFFAGRSSHHWRLGFRAELFPHRDESTTIMIDPKEEAVFKNLQSSATHSWEWGTESQAILEYFYPSLSVFSTEAIVPIPLNAPTPTKLVELIDLILAGVNPNTSPVLVDGDGAAGDPMSLEVAVLLINATGAGNRSLEYARRAEQQLEHLLTVVPRTKDGAISQRENEVQLWSDYMYQAPPGIAYYGLLTSNVTLLEEAYNQCKFYRKYQQDTTTKLWRHILLGSYQDTGLWSTGNGWAAAGMMRVLQTLEHASSLSSKTGAWRRDLVGWIQEILDAAWTLQGTQTMLLPNYLNRSDNRAFDEVSGTALLAATTFRLASYTKGSATTKSLQPALKARQAIWEKQVTDKGIVFPVVNPLNWNQGYPFEGTSPEGQAFALLMQKAYKDFSGLCQQWQNPAQLVLGVDKNPGIRCE